MTEGWRKIVEDIAYLSVMLGSNPTWNELYDYMMKVADLIPVESWESAEDIVNGKTAERYT